EAEIGGEIVRVPSQVPNRLVPIGIFSEPVWLPRTVRRQPRPDVASARDSRQIVNLLEQAKAFERLKHAKAKGGAAYTAARERKADQAILQRRSRVPDGVARRVDGPESPFDFGELLGEDLLRREGGGLMCHVCTPQK